MSRNLPPIATPDVVPPAVQSHVAPSVRIPQSGSAVDPFSPEELVKIFKPEGVDWILVRELLGKNMQAVVFDEYAFVEGGRR